MNKEYTYTDGKVIISDENGNQKHAQYYDNLDDVLAQENVIETMIDRITELEKESKFYKRRNIKHYIIKHYIPIFSPVFGIISAILMALAGTVTKDILVFLSLPFSGCLFADLHLYERRKESLKSEKGVNSELEFLRKQIIKERQILEDLKKVKKVEKSRKEEFEIVEVDDKQQLSNLKNFSSLYFALGYNEKEFLKYYQQGKLEEKLRPDYNDRSIEIAKEYLEENAPALVKRRKYH